MLKRDLKKSTLLKLLTLTGPSVQCRGLWDILDLKIDQGKVF